MTVSSEDLDSCALLSLRLEGDLWDAGAEPVSSDDDDDLKDSRLPLQSVSYM